MSDQSNQPHAEVRAEDRAEEGPPEVADLPVLSAPAEGIGPVVADPPALAQTVEALGAGSGPIAVDAERAQSYRYSAKAYLFQLRRQGSGTHLIDPIAFEEPDPVSGLRPLAEVMAGQEWIIHAASQDLPCLAMVGLVPERIFDTELAGRLLGLPKVGLGAMLEQFFQVRLLKEHSAANWSNRPIPRDWLAYAALDVELLVELRDKLHAQLVAAGKDEWARQEFDWQISSFAAVRPEDPERWRRTSGLATLRSQVALALVRELWDERDLLAERYDLAPSKVLIDRAITELAALVKHPHHQVPTRAQLRTIDGFKRRHARRFENNWVGAMDRVRLLARSELPPIRVPSDGPPQTRSWELRHPEAFARWQRVRPAMNDLAEQWTLPPENLVQPDALRRITFTPPPELTVETVAAALAEYGVRPWQRDLVAPPLVELLAD